MTTFGTAPPVTEDDATHYPGSKQVRRSVSGVSRDPWEEYPFITMQHRSVMRRFYTVGVLAEQLGRSSQTIRKWENWGYIPRSPYRYPGRSSSTHHRKEGQRRLFTREQIEGVVSIARECGVVAPPGQQTKKIGGSGFPEKVAEFYESMQRAPEEARP